MADTSALKEVSEYVVNQVAQILNVNLSKKQVFIGSKKKVKTFDGVSKNAEIVVKVQHHSGNTSGGNKPTAKIRNTFADCYFLSLANAERKILVFTNQEYYEIFKNESDGLLEGIELLLIELPNKYKMVAERVSKQASEEMTKI